ALSLLFSGAYAHHRTVDLSGLRGAECARVRVIRARRLSDCQSFDDKSVWPPERCLDAGVWPECIRMDYFSLTWIGKSGQVVLARGAFRDGAWLFAFSRQSHSRISRWFSICGQFRVRHRVA